MPSLGTEQLSPTAIWWAQFQCMHNCSNYHSLACSLSPHPKPRLLAPAFLPSFLPSSTRTPPKNAPPSSNWRVSKRAKTKGACGNLLTVVTAHVATSTKMVSRPNPEARVLIDRWPGPCLLWYQVLLQSLQALWTWGTDEYRGRGGVGEERVEAWVSSRAGGEVHVWISYRSPQWLAVWQSLRELIWVLVIERARPCFSFSLLLSKLGTVCVCGGGGGGTVCVCVCVCAVCLPAFNTA